MNRRHLLPIIAAVGGVGLLVVHALASFGATAALVAVLVGALAVVAIAAPAVTGSATPRARSIALAVGAAWWTASVVVVSDPRPSDGPAYPGLAGALCALALPWLFVAVAASPERRTHDRWIGTDLSMGAVAVSSMLWLVAIEPHLAGREVPGGATVWVVGLIVVHLTLVARVIGSGVESAGPLAGALALVTALATVAVGHALVGWWSPDVPGSGPPVAWRVGATAMLAAPVLLGVAATLPRSGSARRSGTMATGDPSSLVRTTRTGVTVLVAAVPMGSLASVAVIGDEPVTTTSIVVVTAATVVLLALAAHRAWDLVVSVHETTERQGQARLTAMVEYSNDVVMIVDADASVTYVSPGLSGALGYPTTDWVGRNFADVVAEEDRAMALERFRSLVAGSSDRTVEFEAVLVRHDGQRRHGSVVMVNLLGDGAVGGVVATFRDVTEQRDLERQLSHRAFHDELTGLANRALFLDRMDHALRITRNDGEPVMVLFIDLDDFKEVNDVHGHGVGDETLRSIAERIRATAGPGDTVARLGGDEFAVLLEDSGGIDQAIELAERLLTVLRDPVSRGGADVVVLASIGIAVAVPGTNTTNLLRDADIAMYEAKRAGKGQIRIFDPAMRRIASRHLAYRSELSNAIVRGQLRVVYLPYVDLATGEARGAEALVRWHHPDHGEISPSEFIPIAERTGLIVPIGRWVLGEALDQVATWSSDVELFVSLNVSAVELGQPDLLEHLLVAVRSRGLEPGALMLEVTETDLVDDGDRAVETVAELRRHGFGVALDDFGAGYCSISYLQQHPVDMIKIDPTFVAELDDGSSGNTLARAILHLTTSLGVVSAAEGIESATQLRSLRQLGCRLGQGHLLSAPLEAAVIARRFGRTEGAVSSGRR